MLRLRTYRLTRRLLLSAMDPLSPDPEEDERLRTSLIRAVSLDDYRRNLRTMIDIASTAEASTIFLSICTHIRTYASTMRNVAEERGIPVLDTRGVFVDAMDALEAGELMPDRVAMYRNLFGEETMAHKPWLYVTSDGCHPNWVGSGLIAERLAPMVRRALDLPAQDPRSGEIP